MTARDENGRFVKGHNVKSPGRPPREVETDVLRQMLTEGRVDKFMAAVDKMLTLAKGGNVSAFNAIIGYYAGKPGTVSGLTSADLLLLNRIITKLEQLEIPASSVFNDMLAELENAQNE
jgi:hypothetical protein